MKRSSGAFLSNCGWLLLPLMAAHCHVTYANEQILHFELPAQPISGALLEFSRQTGFDLLAGEGLENRQSGSLRGDYTVTEALGVLLANTGLEFSVIGKSILIRKMESHETVSRDTAESAGTPIDDIVVTGIRASLQRSLNFKRNANYLSEVITQEDFGEFPDGNVAESLQRMTGTAITRTRAGEGQFITVRGLGQQFNLVTLNGRTLPTDNTGTEFSFDVLPSELISQASIIKSPTASMRDGSIGAIVDMRTARPLEQPGFHLSTNVGAQYDELAKGWGEKGALFISNSFNDDTVGASLGVVYSDRQWRADMVQSLGFNFKDLDINNDNVKTANEKHLYVPLYTAYALKTGDRQRLGVTSTVQFEIVPAITSTLDILYSNYRTPEFGTYQTNNVDQVFKADSAYTFDPNSLVADKNGSITHFVINDYPTEVAIDPKKRVVETWLVGSNTSWQVQDNVKLSVDLSYSYANRPEAGRTKFWVAGIKHAKAEFTAGVPIPSFDVSLADGRPISEARDDEIYVHFMESKGDSIKDRIGSFATDISISLDTEYVSSLNLGISAQRREKQKIVMSGENPCAFCGYNFSFADVNLSATDVFPVNDFLKDYHGSFSRSWPVLNTEKLFLIAKAAEGKIIKPGTGQPYPEGTSDQLIPKYNGLASNKVVEDIYSLYQQIDVQFNEITGNAGLRTVFTSMYSLGTAKEILGISPFDNTSNNRIQFGPEAPVDETNTYTMVLPSINLRKELTDDLLIRAALAKTIARPSLAQLGVDKNAEANDSLKRVSSNGNPSLRPITSLQGDVAIEWYYAENSILSADAFYKQIDGFVANVSHNEVIVGEIFEVSKPENNKNIYVYGLEIGAQHFFENGVGFQANYSAADAQSKEASADLLENLSKNSWNYVLIYESNQFEIRLANSYRSRYLQSASGQAGRPETVDDYNQLDLRASYKLNKNIQFWFDGVNLQKSYRYVYSDYRNRFIEFEQFGRRFSVGVKYTL